MALEEGLTMIRMVSPQLGEEERAAVLEVMDSGQLAQGPRVAAFEAAFARVCHVPYAAATTSGTTALHMALLALGVGPGDEVITTPFSFIASANAVLFCGARPVFADVDPVTFNLCPARVEEKVTTRTKAVLAVHLYGTPCDLDGLGAVCAAGGLALVEDACQAHGATYDGRPVGGFGVGCFSFYPTKNITSCEGGIVTTHDPEIARRVRLLRNHGMERRYYHDELGYNFRMTDLQAAMGMAQVPKLASFNKRRRENAAYYDAHIAHPSMIVPSIPSRCESVYHQYTLRISANRDYVQRRLQEQGIETAIYYPLPIHQQPVYQQLGYRDSLPAAERLSREVLSIPVHPGLEPYELERVATALNAI